MVCGSYVTGEPTGRSDIDLHIILSPDVEWRERGNRYVDGFLVEYFANPPGQIRRYFANDFASYSTSSMVQFLTGTIIFDDQGVLSELQQEAAVWKSKKHEPLEPSKGEAHKYALWDALDNLLDCYEAQRADFDFVYHNSLRVFFAGYCSLLNWEQIPFDHLFRYLAQPSYLEKYRKEPFPDQEFALLFQTALECTDNEERVQLAQALLAHIFRMTGGFEIDGWRLRTPAEK